MTTHEHAQLIYAQLLGGTAAAGKSLPAHDDKGLLEMAWMYAKQFEQKALGKS